LILSNIIGKEIFDLWWEYENATTPEAKVVKQLDKFEMIFQATQYEKAQGHNLQEFFESARGQITHPQLLEWANELEKRRTTAHKSIQLANNSQTNT
jgi:putative hydrolase of HD superfamily